MSLNARTVALVFGVVYLLVGIIGFVLPSPLLGIFTVDPMPYHNVVHVLLGVLGIGAAYSGMSRLYCQVVGIVLLLLAVVGVLTTGGDGMLLGILHLNLADHLLHLVSGAVLAYFGFMGTERVMARS